MRRRLALGTAREVGTRWFLSSETALDTEANLVLDLRTLRADLYFFGFRTFAFFLQDQLVHTLLTYAFSLDAFSLEQTATF